MYFLLRLLHLLVVNARQYSIVKEQEAVSVTPISFQRKPDRDLILAES